MSDPDHIQMLEGSSFERIEPSEPVLAIARTVLEQSAEILRQNAQLLRALLFPAMLVITKDPLDDHSR